MAIEVSIIVPCRNEVSAIATTLESIRSQDPIDGDFEVIVADGMSDDGSREILNQLIESDPRITMETLSARFSVPGGMIFWNKL